MARDRFATRSDAQLRLRTGHAYLEVAELVLSDERSEMPGVAAGLAVLAGIAASDAICVSRLGSIYRGENHRDAVELLRVATMDGKKLSTTFLKLIDVKDEAHYGLITVAPRKARDAVRWASILVRRAQEELER